MSARQMVRTAEIQPGDALLLGGEIRTIERVEPYPNEQGHHPTVPSVDRRIVCTDGWSMSAESRGAIPFNGGSLAVDRRVS